MKKIKIVLATVLFSAFALTSCSSDDDGAPTTLVGKWNPTKTTTVVGSGNGQTTNYVDNQVSCGKDYIEFTGTNIVKNVVWNKSADGVCSEAPGDAGAYAKVADVLTITGGVYEGTYAVSRLTGSELRLVETATVGGAVVTSTRFFSKAK